MGEREELLRRWRKLYERILRRGRCPGPVKRWWSRRKAKRLVSAPPYGPPGGWDGDDGGGAGVREPRRPLPRTPQGAAELPRD